MNLDDAGPWDPASIREDAFLAGPARWEAWDGEGDLLVVDDILAKPFSRILSEQGEADPDSVDPAEGAISTPSQLRPGYACVDVAAGVLLIFLFIRPGGILGEAK